MRKVVAGVFCLLFSSGTLSEIYKWSDEQGRVHYSDKAPAKKTDVLELKQVGKSSDPASSRSTAYERNTLENTQRFLRTLEEEKAIKQEKEAKRAEKREKVEAYCKRLEKEINIYEKRYAIVRYNQKGEHEYLTDQEISDQKKAYHQRWKEYCEK